jgi:hypothetical protein
MEALKDEEKSESTMSDLDDMWYTGDKESNIQDFEDEVGTTITSIKPHIHDHFPVTIYVLVIEV